MDADTYEEDLYRCQFEKNRNQLCWPVYGLSPVSTEVEAKNKTELNVANVQLSCSNRVHTFLLLKMYKI